MVLANSLGCRNPLRWDLVLSEIAKSLIETIWAFWSFAMLDSNEWRPALPRSSENAEARCPAC